MKLLISCFLVVLLTLLVVSYAGHSSYESIIHLHGHAIVVRHEKSGFGHASKERISIKIGDRVLNGIMGMSPYFIERNGFIIFGRQDDIGRWLCVFDGLQGKYKEIFIKNWSWIGFSCDENGKPNIHFTNNENTISINSQFPSGREITTIYLSNRDIKQVKVDWIETAHEPTVTTHAPTNTGTFDANPK